MCDAPQRLDPETLRCLSTGLRLIALRSLGDADAADEVVQETIARGLGALKDGRPEDPDRLGAYFRGICHHVIVDTIRARQRTTSLDGLPEPRASEASHDMLQVLISEEEGRRIARALRAVTPEARECLRLSFFEGMKPAEIAERLGEPGPRIRKRLSRAIDSLRRAFLDDRG